MPLGTVVVLGILAIGLLFAIGANLYYAILVNEVQQRLPESQQIRFPFASWSVFTVTRLHQQFYPTSRARVVYRFMVGSAIASFALIGIIGAAFAFSKPPR
jgi:hypothetical protein